MFIEFPDSAIHWMEPRDITVEEAVQLINRYADELPGGLVVGMIDGSSECIGRQLTISEVQRLFDIASDGLRPEEFQKSADRMD